MNKFIIAIITLAILSMAGAVMAADTANLTVSATVVGTCKFSVVGALNFGNLDPSVGGDVKQAPVDRDQGRRAMEAAGHPCRHELPRQPGPRGHRKAHHGLWRRRRGRRHSPRWTDRLPIGPPAQARLTSRPATLHGPGPGLAAISSKATNR